MRYYWCVNCGHSEDYGFDRKRSIKCRVCGSTTLTELTETEYLAEKQQLNSKTEDLTEQRNFVVGLNDNNQKAENKGDKNESSN